MFPIDEFIALKAKMYSYMVDDKDSKEDNGEEKSKANGVRKCVVNKDINHQCTKIH